MIITEPGLYEIDHTDYHADPCPEPSLNNSLIGPLLNSCPATVKHSHPRLNPLYVPKESSRMDLGTVAHKLLLGRGRDYVALDFDDWRTKAAKEARDAARMAGKVPILVDDLATALNMVSAARSQLARFDGPDPFDLSTGKFEVGMFWRDESGVWGRNLIDRLRDDLPIWELWDYKTMGRSANPEAMALSTHVVDMGYDTQCAMQERGLLTLFPQLGGRIKFRWVFQEVDEPYLISVVEPDEATMTIARKKVDYAFKLFADCLANKSWPGYPAKVVPLRHAEFLANRWLEREVSDQVAAGGANMVDLLMGRSKPVKPHGRPKGSKNRKRVLIPPGQNILGSG